MSSSHFNPLRHSNRSAFRKPPSEEILRDFTRLLSLVTGRFKPNDIDVPTPEKALIFSDSERSNLRRLSQKRQYQTTCLNIEHSL